MRGGGVQAAEVSAVLRDLRAAGCRVWVAGGWGVDVLVGRQTRVHRDLDLAVDARDEDETLRLLGRRGYRVETDWRPVRVELVHPSAGWVDLHPVTFDETGRGRQADLDGGAFDYPVTAFVSASFGGVEVGCLSAAQQVAFRRGYPLRPVDLHDLEALHTLGPSLGEAPVDEPGAAPGPASLTEAELSAALPGLLRDSWAVEPAMLVASSGPVGMGSVTTGVEAGVLGPLVAKWVPQASAEALDRGSAVAAELRRAGLQVGAAVPTATGGLSAPFLGGRLALLRRVEGRPLTGASGLDQERMAVVLSRVHAVRRPWASADAYLDDSLSDARPVESWVVASVEAVRARYRDLGPVTWGLVHHDPAPEAFFHDDASEVTSLIDWTGAGAGPLLFDVASTVMYLGGADRASVFVERYRGLAPDPLRDEGDELLGFFAGFRAAVQAAYFSRRVADVDLTGVSSQAENLDGLHHARRMLLEAGVAEAR